AAKRPSPRAPGRVFDVAASLTPASESARISRDISTVSPGSSSSNSSIHTKEYSLSTSTVVVKLKAPTRLVYSTNVPNAFCPGASCHKEAKRWVFPTPKPPSKYKPFGLARRGLSALRENSEEKSPLDFWLVSIDAANSLRRSTASACDCCAGSCINV